MSIGQWDFVRIYFEGDEYFRDAISQIEQAQSEIFIESYIFDYDPIGISVLESCARAARRGVQVSITVDGVGSFNSVRELMEFCKKNKIHFHIYHPLPMKISKLRQISWKYLVRLLNVLKKINKRNHRKLFLIDSSVCFLGGMNISQVHSHNFMGDQTWRDSAIQVRGEPLSFLRIELLRTLKDSGFHGYLKKRLLRKDRTPKQVPQQALRLNSHFRWRFALLKDLIRRLNEAQSRILITNAYFVPRTNVLKAIRKAAERGVEVALVLPSLTDVPPVQWASRSLYRRMLKSGVRIFEYQPTILHAKTLIIDDWATVGSHNLNHRSITHDLEVEAVLTDPTSHQVLLNRWHQDVQMSKEITVENLGHFPLWQSVLARLAYWLRYWI